MRRILASAGFSLVEALVACFVAATAIVAFAHLVALAAEQTVSARRAAAARALAQSKIEELRAEAWTYDAAGVRVSSGALAASPDSTLTADTAGFVDRLDRFGAAMEEGVPHYRRRWSVAPLDAADPDTLTLQACVLTTRDAPDACVWTLRTRRP